MCAVLHDQGSSLIVEPQSYLLQIYALVCNVLMHCWCQIMNKLIMAGIFESIELARSTAISRTELHPFTAALISFVQSKSFPKKDASRALMCLCACCSQVPERSAHVRCVWRWQECLPSDGPLHRRGVVVSNFLPPSAAVACRTGALGLSSCTVCLHILWWYCSRLADWLHHKNLFVLSSWNMPCLSLWHSDSCDAGTASNVGTWVSKTLRALLLRSCAR